MKRRPGARRHAAAGVQARRLPSLAARQPRARGAVDRHRPVDARAACHAVGAPRRSRPRRPRTSSRTRTTRPRHSRWRCDWRSTWTTTPAAAEPPPPTPSRLTHGLKQLSTLQWALIVSVGAARRGCWPCASPTRRASSRVFADTPLEVILVNARSHRGADQGAGDRAGQPGWRRRSRQGPRHLAAAGVGHRRAGRLAARGAPQASTSCKEQQQQLLAQMRRQVALRCRRLTRSARRARRRSASRKSAGASCCSCWPRSRSASTMKTRGRRSATSARPRAKRSTPSTTTSCAARSKSAARATFPSTSGKKLYGELTMNVTVDAARPRGRSRDRARRRSRACSTGGRSPSCTRPRRSARSRTAMRAQADQIVVTLALPLHARGRPGDHPAAARCRSERCAAPLPDRYVVAGQPGGAQPLAVHPRRVRAADRRADRATARVLCAARRLRRVRQCARFERTGRPRAAATSPCRSSCRRLRWPAAPAPRAALAQAAATCCASTPTGWFADNTDGIGLVRDIEHHAGVAHRRARVLLVGAGGAAAGVLGPLIDARPALRVVVANRTPRAAPRWSQRRRRAGRRCAALARRARGRWRPAPFDVVDQRAAPAACTACAAPVPAPVLKPGALAIDLMYGPARAPFLDWARAHGAQRARRPGHAGGAGRRGVLRLARRAPARPRRCCAALRAAGDDAVMGAACPPAGAGCWWRWPACSCSSSLRGCCDGGGRPAVDHLPAQRVVAAAGTSNGEIAWSQQWVD